MGKRAARPKGRSDKATAVLALLPEFSVLAEVAELLDRALDQPDYGSQRIKVGRM